MNDRTTDDLATDALATDDLATDDLTTPQPRPKRLVVIMDGTWNSPGKESTRDNGDKLYKPTNPLKTGRAVKDFDEVAATLVIRGRPRDGDTVTVGSRVYTFVEGLDAEDDADGHVAIRETGRRSLENLR